MNENDYVSMSESCCSVPFKLSKIHYNHRVEDGKAFYCPACGGCRYFSKKEELEAKLKQIETQRSSEVESNRILHRQLAAQRGATTRMKNKIKQLQKEK